MWYSVPVMTIHNYTRFRMLQFVTETRMYIEN